MQYTFAHGKCTCTFFLVLLCILLIYRIEGPGAFLLHQSDFMQFKSQIQQKNGFLIAQAFDPLESRILNGSQVGNRSKWSKEVLQLDYRCPIILSGHHQISGLGHSFMSYNSLVAMSSFYRITLNATFPEGLSHGVKAEHIAPFFTGDIFRSRFPHSNCKKTICVDIDSVPSAIEEARSSCNQGPVCVRLTTNASPSESLIDVESYRKNFQVPQEVLTELHQLPFFQKHYFRVAIHIRRGDIINSTKPMNNRWIYNKAYIEFLPKLVKRIRTKLPIILIIFAEGAETINKIPDVTVNTFDNFSAIHDNITLGPTSMELSLATLCSSDIVITSTSGFSHLSAILCEKPGILAVPFWHSYEGIPNLITELTAHRNSDNSIIKLELPATFHHEFS